MKAFTQLVSVATLFFTIVAAAPSPDVDASELLFTREASLRPEADNFIKWMKANPAQVNQKSLCFYTGGTELTSKPGVITPVHTALGRFAAQVNCEILQDVLKRFPSAYNDQNNWGDAEWTEVSRVTAQLVSKDPVYSLLGKTVKVNSVWETAEKPELLKNKAAGIIKNILLYEYTPQDTFVATGKL